MKYSRSITYSLLFTLFAFTTISAQNWYGNGIKGKGPIIEKELNLAAFTGFKISNSANVVLTQGSTQKVVAKGQENIIDNLKMKVEDGIWKIAFKKGVRESKSFTIYITIPELKMIGVSGSGDVNTTNTFKGVGDLKLSVSGSGDLELAVEAKTISTRLSGSGNLTLDGQTQDQQIRISGSGDLDAFDMNSRSCSVRVSGSGVAKVHASESLSARVSGSGDVYYKGSPEKVSSKVSGSGDIEPRG